MFRICQEALTKIVRHANARRVAISVVVRHGHFVLRVCDNRIGVPSDVVDGKRESVRKLIPAGVDLAKNAFRLHGVDRSKNDRRGQLGRLMLGLDLLENPKAGVPALVI